MRNLDYIIKDKNFMTNFEYVSQDEEMIKTLIENINIGCLVLGSENIEKWLNKKVNFLEWETFEGYRINKNLIKKFLNCEIGIICNDAWGASEIILSDYINKSGILCKKDKTMYHLINNRFDEELDEDLDEDEVRNKKCFKFILEKRDCGLKYYEINLLNVKEVKKAVNFNEVFGKIE